MNVRKPALIAAAVVASLFAVALFFFVNSFQRANAPELARVPVLVANMTIDKGVTVTRSMFATVLRDRTSIDPDAVSNPALLHGQFALIAIPAGSVLTLAKIGTPRDVGLSMRLHPGERAVSISVDQVKDVSGLLLPGDRVDILAQGPRVDNKIIPAIVLLRGILVLAVGQGLETTAASPNNSQASAATVTLALTSSQATALLTADQNATIRLALRSPKERLLSSRVQDVVYNGHLSNAATSENAPRPVAAPPAPAVAQAPLATPQMAVARATSPPQKLTTGVQVIEGTTLVGPG